MNKIAIAALAALISAAPASAQLYRQPDADPRQQTMPVYRGVSPRDLSLQERRDFKRDQRNIQRQQKRAMDDGTMTYEERKRIERLQNQALRDMYRRHQQD